MNKLTTTLKRFSKAEWVYSGLMIFGWYLMFNANSQFAAGLMIVIFCIILSGAGWIEKTLSSPIKKADNKTGL